MSELDPYISSAAMFFTNIGVKYIIKDIDCISDFFDHPYMLYVYLFSLFYIANHNISLSIIMVLLYKILVPLASNAMKHHNVVIPPAKCSKSNSTGMSGLDVDETTDVDILGSSSSSGVTVK